MGGQYPIHGSFRERSQINSKNNSKKARPLPSSALSSVGLDFRVLDLGFNDYLVGDRGSFLGVTIVGL